MVVLYDLRACDYDPGNLLKLISCIIYFIIDHRRLHGGYKKKKQRETNAKVHVQNIQEVQGRT